VVLLVTFAVDVVEETATEVVVVFLVDTKVDVTVFELT